ncbi:MAG: hypothetical protein LBL04_14090 [Bacteroidales bacterium]|jgi:hypothetical protein|nr:hypothetical protein [Bacteroidales bacterium]
MNFFSVELKVTVPNRIREDGSIVRYKPKRFSGLIMTTKRTTMAEAGKEAADQFKVELSKSYPEGMVEVIRVAKLKDDFAFNSNR